MTLSLSNPNQYVIVMKDTEAIGQVPNDAREAFKEISRSFASTSVCLKYDDAEAEEILKATEAEFFAQEVRHKEEEEMHLQYVLWSSKCEAVFRSSVPIVDFPYLPPSVCICDIEGCKNRKSESGLFACRHDVERLLRASGLYSKTWLRNERVAWHPDRFGRKCSHAHKGSLQKVTTELYAIFEELIADEGEKRGENE